MRQITADNSLAPIEFLVRLAVLVVSPTPRDALIDDGRINAELPGHRLMLERAEFEDSLSRQSSSTAEVGQLNDGIDNHRRPGSILTLKEIAKCKLQVGGVPPAALFAGRLCACAAINKLGIALMKCEGPLMSVDSGRASGK